MISSSYALLLLLGAIWGASFLFIKICVSEMGPMTFAFFRVLIGTIVLLAVILVRRQKLPVDRGLWLRFAVMGAVGILVPFSAISWGTQYIASGLSAILNATMPLFTFMLVVILGEEPLNGRRALGLLVGFAGILVLTWPHLQGGLQASLLGELAIVVASLSYALAIVYARRHLVGWPPLVTSLGQLGTATFLLIPLVLLEKPWMLPFPSLKATLSLLTVGVLGTGVGYIIYYRLLQLVGATGTSLVTYIVPVFGIFWGWAILGERLSWHAFAALLLIFGGLFLVNRSSKRRVVTDEPSSLESQRADSR